MPAAGPKGKENGTSVRLWRRLHWWERIVVSVLVALLSLIIWMCAMALYDPTYWD
jgi:hypothetical protein